MASNKVAKSYVMKKQNYEIFFHIKYEIFMNCDKLFEPFNQYLLLQYDVCNNEFAF